MQDSQVRMGPLPRVVTTTKLPWRQAASSHGDSYCSLHLKAINWQPEF